MLITTEQMAEALRAVVDDVAQAVANRILAHKEQYGHYGLLPLHTLHSRALQSLGAILAALEADSYQVLLNQLSGLQQTRLRTGYDPATVLTIMGVINEEILHAVIADNSGNIYLCAALRTKLHLYLNASRLQLARLNMLIAPDERTETDPELGQIMILPEVQLTEPRIGA
jgi:hypothetical protein